MTQQLSARERWLLSRLEGTEIVDVGFAGQKGKLPPYYRAFGSGTRRVIGVDFNEPAVLARAIPRSTVADATRLPFRDGHADAVILGEFLEHQSDLVPFLRECRRVLRVGGQLLITTPNPAFLNRVIRHWLMPRGTSHLADDNVRKAMEYEDHVVLWDPLSVCSVLSRNGFDVRELTTLGIWIPGLGRVVPRFRRGLYVDVWPFNRLGHITCIDARRL